MLPLGVWLVVVAVTGLVLAGVPGAVVVRTTLRPLRPRRHLRSAGSTGLGLAIVSAVVHAHGGAVSATSKPGRTTVTVNLPLASTD